MKLKILLSILLIQILFGCETYADKNGDRKIVLFETNDNKIKRKKNQAYTFIENGNAIEAEKLLESVLSSKLKDKEVYYYLAIAKGMLEKNDEALKYCNEAINIDPKYFGVFVNRGILKLKLGMNEEALSDMTRAISINSNDADAYMNRGIIYIEMKQKDKACLDITKAKELGGEIPEPLYRMACD